MKKYELRNGIVIEGPFSPEQDEFKIVSYGNTDKREVKELLEPSGMLCLAYWENHSKKGEPLTYTGGRLGIDFDVIKEDSHG